MCETTIQPSRGHVRIDKCRVLMAARTLPLRIMRHNHTKRVLHTIYIQTQLNARGSHRTSHIAHSMRESIPSNSVCMCVCVVLVCLCKISHLLNRAKESKRRSRKKGQQTEEHIVIHTKRNY